MDALTVRALAARLDVRAPTLYWHVRNKQELLDEMATAVMRQVTEALEAIPAGADWREDLTAYAHVLRSQYLSRRDGARIFSGTRLSDPQIIRMKEPLLERWTTASEWTPAAADDAIDVVTAFVVGFVIEEQEKRQSAESDPERYSIAEWESWLGEGAPLVKEAGRRRDNGDPRFERHLSIVLNGLMVGPSS